MRFVPTRFFPRVHAWERIAPQGSRKDTAMTAARIPQGPHKESARDSQEFGKDPRGRSRDAEERRRRERKDRGDVGTEGGEESGEGGGGRK